MKTAARRETPAGMIKNKQTYEIMTPESIGLMRVFCLLVSYMPLARWARQSNLDVFAPCRVIFVARQAARKLVSSQRSLSSILHECSTWQCARAAVAAAVPPH